VKIVILGGKGQLGSAIKKTIAQEYPQEIQFISLAKSEFNIAQPSEQQILKLIDYQPKFIINCAAYTQVDQAETEEKQAMLINGHSLKGISELANQAQSHLIHISTDFVFSGQKQTPYTEEDPCAPLSVYGKSKLLGENLIQQTCQSFTIFRTSWLYSTDHPSFLTTMIRLGKEREKINVVYDQIGTPTSSHSLAKTILQALRHKEEINKQIYHYSNEGVCSWYDFANAIFKTLRINVETAPILSNEYPTAAKRPIYSVLSKTKIKKSLNISNKHWQQELQDILMDEQS
jgi:dTDP-4-dehydrorhamnose reductase